MEQNRETQPPTAIGPERRLPVPVFSVRLVRERDHLTEQVSTPKDASRIACELLDRFDREVFLVLALSSSARLIGAHIAHVGTLQGSMACGREIFRFAILCNARSIIVAHNHPSGNLDMSRDDIEVSRSLKQAGELLGITVLDSLVVGFEGQYASLAENGVL